MDIDDVTVCTVSYNAVDAAALMYESFVKYHGVPRLHVWDNGSTDGAAEYLRERAECFYASAVNVWHGTALDALCKGVKTPYILTVDTDIEFVVPIIGILKEHGAFAVHQKNEWDIYPGDLYGYPRQWGFQVWLTLFETEKLQRLLEHFSFTSYAALEQRLGFDTGAMLYRVANAAGLKIAEIDLGQSIIHYGHITCTLFSGLAPQWKEQKTRTYEHIGHRLADLRSNKKRMLTLL